ncbi:hypothetical protein DEIPH_ctg019orf0009 [Deinococcus phoenicis]|uniref:Uncharacterized protein n=1 Tax=Deinococcus phoenicis TaxID=1476583 RepID=A0A016QRK2_9DEIO|nr:ankyrin repeat domain-containing protein [Deinococcus phoenicis]EYB68596.1 hypothetical protein DEIPH_ctg019orf0009 [Deinococcus phoenicis]
MRPVLLAVLLVLPWSGVGGAATPPSPTTLNAALWQAAERGDAARVRDRLKRGASANTRRADGRTALTSAALGNPTAVARLLIGAGADPDPASW